MREPVLPASTIRAYCVSGLSLEYDLVHFASPPGAAVLPWPLEKVPGEQLSVSSLPNSHRTHTTSSCQAVSGSNEVQNQDDEGNDASRLQEARPLAAVHGRGGFVVVHGAGAVSRVPVWLLEGVARRIVAAWKRYGYPAPRARETEVGPDAGAPSNVNAAGHKGVLRVVV